MRSKTPVPRGMAPKRTAEKEAEKGKDASEKRERATLTVDAEDAAAAEWEMSVVDEAMLKDLVEGSLLPDQSLLGWRAAVGHAYPQENEGELVVFSPFFECGFGLPAGAFFRDLLEFYGIEQHQLNPNSVLQIAIFIYLCEGYLGIAPHFDLFRYLFYFKGYPNNKSPGEVRGAGLQLRNGKAKEYIHVPLNESNKGWKREWFYCPNHNPKLAARSGVSLEWGEHWRSIPNEDEMVQVNELLEMIKVLKEQGLTGAAVMISFSRRLIQPIKDRCHPAFEWEGREDPTREQIRAVSNDEVIARVSKYFIGKIGNRGAPKPFSLRRPPPEVKCLEANFNLLHNPLGQTALLTC
jgi:hypothetical protein